MCDLKIVLQALLSRVEPGDCAEWVATLTQWKERWPFPVPYASTIIKPQWAIAKLNEMVEGKAIMITGVGQHQMWAMQLYRPQQPRCFISSSGLGTMGFGLPAAMGAQVGCPDRLVVNIDGDGSFNMTCHELSTLHRYDLPVKNVIINNQYLGMVRQWQDLIYKGHRAESHLADPSTPDWTNADGSCVYPDFVTLARAYGVSGSRVWEPSQLEEAFRKMLAAHGAVRAGRNR